jgi:isopenicillin-N epimerase
MSARPSTNRSRRDFARLFAVGGSAALFAGRAEAWPVVLLEQAPASPDTRYWQRVRDAFIMPAGFACLNAANLCPSPAAVVTAADRWTRSVDEDPSPQNRTRTKDGREAARRKIATALRVTPEEIVITRNTSESNNIVSSGLDLKAGDEVLVLSDNHPSNLAAWRQKAQRFGFTVRTVDQVNPHPGADFYVDAFRRAMTSATKVVAITHVTSSVGDVLPAREICQLARERGVLSMVDGAQSFGVFDLDLSEMQPDFYSGSAHKWPCGARECGVLFVNARVHDRIWPTSYSAYPGAVGISRKMEQFGQRDEATMIAFGEALAFQTKVGRPAIEQRSRALTQQLLTGLRKLEGFTVFTSPVPERTVACATFAPGTLDTRKLVAALYERDKIAITTGGGQGRSGLRVSPHFYNTPEEIDRLLAALTRYRSSGV